MRLSNIFTFPWIHFMGRKIILPYRILVPRSNPPYYKIIITTHTLHTTSSNLFMLHAWLTVSIVFCMVFVFHFGCFGSFRVFLEHLRMLYFFFGVYGEGVQILEFRT